MYMYRRASRGDAGGAFAPPLKKSNLSEKYGFVGNFLILSDFVNNCISFFKIQARPIF